MQSMSWAFSFETNTEKKNSKNFTKIYYSSYLKKNIFLH